MSYSPPPRPVPTKDEFSVWADDRIEAKNQKTTLPVWLCEFAGSREDCLRYLDGVLINLETGNVVWGFAVYPPGTSPKNIPTDPMALRTFWVKTLEKTSTPMTPTELLIKMFGEDWEEITQSELRNRMKKID